MKSPTSPRDASLFDHSEIRRNDTETTTIADRRVSTRRSALWAAYGDALGWISELTGPSGLRKRTRGKPLCKPVEWTRRIGGRAGVVTELPKGCYSDDSQLRLATARTIGPGGFDVEAFAKVELPVWLSYSFGAGRSTTAAAANLARPKVQWFANTFKGWTNSGGNGAAMRIQPHVWAANDLEDAESLLAPVVRNAICSHSHPVGLLGAVLHSLALARALVTKQVPSPDDLLKCIDVAARVPTIMGRDTEVGTYWRGAYERESGAFNDAWARTLNDCADAIRVAAKTDVGFDGATNYASVIDRLRLRERSRRGSGTLTAVAAMSLAWCESCPYEAMRIAANELGTDTDTIATMTGAILGAVADNEPPVEVLDAELFRQEADRLVEVAEGKRPRSHNYPDLLRWSAPATRSDALLRLENGGLHVLGLGSAEAQGPSIPAADGKFEWQWIKLEIGQTLLIKRRVELRQGNEGPTARPIQQRPRIAGDYHATAIDDRRGPRPFRASRSVNNERPQAVSKTKSSRPLDIKRALDYIAERKYDDKCVGAALRQVVQRGTTGEIVAFTAALIDHMKQRGTNL